VAEWLKAHAWKVCIRETVSRVRIPLPPPVYCFFSFFIVRLNEIGIVKNRRAPIVTFGPKRP
jgi:hypothetical protein